MTFPGPGDEPYAGPPPTRRPERWERPPRYWRPAQPAPVPWAPVPWAARATAARPAGPLGAAAGHPAARRPPAVPARDAVPRLGVVAAAARACCCSGSSTSSPPPSWSFLTLATGVGTDFAQLDLVDPLTLLVTNLSLIVAIPVRVDGLGRPPTAWAGAGRPRCSPGCAGGCSCRYALMAAGTLGIGIGGVRAGRLPAGRGRGHRAGRLVRLAARGRRPHHSAAVGGGGVPVPRLPEPGDRRRGCGIPPWVRWSPAS